MLTQSCHFHFGLFQRTKNRHHQCVSMNTIYQGVLNGIFRQMPIAAWFRAQCKRIQLTVVLPSPLPLGEWQATLLRRTSCWPYRLPQDLPELRPQSKATFIRLRKRGQSKHILGGLVVNWDLIRQHLWTRTFYFLQRRAH